MLPLDDVTVVAVEQAVAAPFATRHLADLGARVIKVERPDGGDFARWYDGSVAGQSSFFVWLNRGKRSVTLDLKSAGAVDLLRELIAGADVFVQNLAPGAAARLGLDSAELAGAHPHLITCDISGYGPDGPWAGRKAYDLLVQCETGVAALTGTPGQPAKVGVSVADIAAGMYAFAGILTALYERVRTGRGRSLSVSLIDSLAEWMSAPALMTAGTGCPPQPAGLAHPTIAPYGPYPASDGTVIVAVQNNREFRRLAGEVLGRPGLAVDPRYATNSDRVANRAALDADMGAVTGRMTADELIARLDAARIANARLRDVAGLLAHPQLSARGRWRPVATPAGTVDCLAPPVTFAGLDLPMGPVPALGEHTAAVLADLGRPGDQGRPGADDQRG